MDYRLVNNPTGSVNKYLFVNQIKKLVSVFPTWKYDTQSKDVMNLLYEYLGYCDDNHFVQGINDYIINESNNPTISGLRKYITSSDNRRVKLSDEYKYTESLDCFDLPNKRCVISGGYLWLNNKYVSEANVYEVNQFTILPLEEAINQGYIEKYTPEHEKIASIKNKQLT